MSKYDKLAIKLHKKYRGKMEIQSKVSLKSRDDMSVYYTPGVAEPCRQIYKNKNLVNEYTNKANNVAIICDGTAVLGLGDIGPEAALPVMEGKAILFKKLANIDAYPLCINTTKVDEIVALIANISPNFGGINLEDIAAPRCFEITEKLQKQLKIPVFHDDQYGTAIVVLAALKNALKIVKKDLKKIKIVINGAGAAGLAVSKLLFTAGARKIILCDSRGVIYEGRKDLNKYKVELASLTNQQKLSGQLVDVLKNSDIFIGLSVADVLSTAMIKSMTTEPIIFAMANPEPEILPDKAIKAGARIVATGRSDFLNQINNVLVFPGLFRGALDKKISRFTNSHYLKVADALADIIKKPRSSQILPTVFNKKVVNAIAQSI